MRYLCVVDDENRYNYYDCYADQYENPLLLKHYKEGYHYQ
jgi:hypothetical protein